MMRCTNPPLLYFTLCRLKLLELDTVQHSVLHVSIKQFFMDYKSGPLLWQAPTFSCSNAQPPILCKAGSIHEKFAPVLKKQTELASQVQSEFIISLQQTFPCAYSQSYN